MKNKRELEKYSVNTKQIGRGITQKDYNKNPSDYGRHERANSER